MNTSHVPRLYVDVLGRLTRTHQMSFIPRDAAPFQAKQSHICKGIVRIISNNEVTCFLYMHSTFVHSSWGDPVISNVFIQEITHGITVNECKTSSLRSASAGRRQRPQRGAAWRGATLDQIGGSAGLTVSLPPSRSNRHSLVRRSVALPVARLVARSAIAKR